MRETQRQWVALVGAVALCASACSGGFTLSVDVRTDFSPRSEFDTVRVAVDGVAHDRAASTLDDYTAGVRALELGGLRAGSHTIDVSLLEGSVVVVARRVAVDLHGDYALLVTLTRSCAGVVCPRAGDPADATTCMNGMCAAPDCGTVGGPACPACHVDSECAASSVACVVPRCMLGACLGVPDSSRCTSGLVCDGASGCVPGDVPDAASALDGGAVGVDAGMATDGGSAGTDGGLVDGGVVGVDAASGCDGIATCYCLGDGDCSHYPSMPYCDVTRHACAECTASNENFACRGHSCRRTLGTCTTTMLHSVTECQPCQAGSECASGLDCFASTLPGSTHAYCLHVVGGATCATVRPPYGHYHAGVTDVDGTVVNECAPIVDCAIFNAFDMACLDVSWCGGGGMYAECVHPPGGICSYDCAAPADCPGGSTCISGVCTTSA